MKYENVRVDINFNKDNYGLHISIFFIPTSDSTDDSLDTRSPIGLVIYHANTNSITLGKYREDGVSDMELVEHFMKVYRSRSFKNYLKLMGCSIHTRPVWSKQLKRHFA